jgi:hypothetical protein
MQEQDWGLSVGVWSIGYGEGCEMAGTSRQKPREKRNTPKPPQKK